MEKQIWA